MHNAKSKNCALCIFHFAFGSVVLESSLAKDINCVPRHRTQIQLSQHMNTGRLTPVSVRSFTEGC